MPTHLVLAGMFHMKNHPIYNKCLSYLGPITKSTAGGGGGEQNYVSYF